MVLALIPARKGSKGLPNKNLKEFCGKPLIEYSIGAALQSGVVDKVIVSTDYEFEDIPWSTTNSGAVFVKRPARLCTDNARLDKTLLHIAKTEEFDVLVLLQPTSPLRDGQDVKRAMEHYRKSNCNSLVSVCEQKAFIWIDKAAKIGNMEIPIGLYNPQDRPNRQEKRDIFRENGAIYITTKQGILESGCRINGTVTLFPMSERNSLEIDSLQDWKIGEILHG
jgi:CMP-N,N'-diacetyllegionaminic acid synthase